MIEFSLHWLVYLSDTLQYKLNLPSFCIIILCAQHKKGHLMFYYDLYVLFFFIYMR